MEARSKVYCVNCGEFHNYILESSIEKVTVRDVTFNYLEMRALCDRCKKKIYIPAINDRNYYERHKAYYEKLHDIFKEEENEYQGSYFQPILQ